MNPTTPEQLSYAITDSLARTFRLIVLQQDNDVNLDWTWHKGHTNAVVMIDRDLTNTNGGRHTLDRLRNALNAFGYDFTAHDVPSGCALFISLSDEIQQEASDADYSDFCDREEEQLQKSGRLY